MTETSNAAVIWDAALQDAERTARMNLKPAYHRHVTDGLALIRAGQATLEPGDIAVLDIDDTQWTVSDTSCPCPDSVAERGYCLHNITRRILLSARKAAQKKPMMDDAVFPATRSMAPTRQERPPADVHGVPPEHIEMIQGRPYVTYRGLLALATLRGLVQLEAHFISVTPELALARAVAAFEDGRHFEEAGDATPANVAQRVRPHFARMALTRAKARCLRDALNLGGIVTAEEMDE